MVSKKDSNKARLKRRKRVRAKISGTAACPRLSVYRSLNHIYAQLVDDANGVTLAAAATVEKEFEDLGQVLDGLYLSNHIYNNDLFKYSFKFARAKNDMNGLGLYDYVDKKVLSTVQHYLHRIGNNRVSDYISAITLSDTELNVLLARNQKVEDYN